MTQKTNPGLCTLTVLLIHSAPSFAADVVISTKDKKFSTKEVSVLYGDSLVFKNDEVDGTVHSIYSLTPEYEFDLKAQKPGETKIQKIEKEKLKPGKFEVGCAVHPDQPNEQKLQVTVKDK